MNWREYKNIISQLNQYDTICFDLFDTLLHSKYSRKYSFYKYAEFIINEYHVKQDLYVLADSLNTLFRDTIKTTIHDIYLHYQIGNYIDYASFEKDTIDVFITSEKENLFISDYVIGLLKLIKDQGKTLVLISDFYFGKQIIIPLLNHFNINVFDKVFISYDCDCGKNNGRIYDLLNNKESCMMIGDNLRSDCQMATRNGISSFHLNASSYNKRYMDYDNNLSKYSPKRIWQFHIKEKQFYSCNYAFIIFEFCKKLYTELNSEDKVYFMAREGQFIKKCFDYYLSFNNKKNISTEYLFISRIAIANLTNDYNASDFDFLNQFKNYSEWKINKIDTYLSILGLNDNNIKSIRNQYNIVGDNPDQLHQLFKIDSFIGLLRDKQNEARQKFMSYFNTNSKRIVLVDFGGRGTMQNYITKLFESKYEIYGFYFGLSPTNGEYTNSYKKGLIFEYNNEFFTGKNNKNSSTFEALLRADHGSVVCYKKEDDLIINDASVNVYNNYSKIRQEKMFWLFKQMCALNRSCPIESDAIKRLYPKIMDKPKICEYYDNYYAGLQEKLDDKEQKVPSFSYSHYYIQKILTPTITLFRRGFHKCIRIVKRV